MLREKQSDEKDRSVEREGYGKRTKMESRCAASSSVNKRDRAIRELRYMYFYRIVILSRLSKSFKPV